MERKKKMNEQFYTMITFENLYEAHKKSRSGKREKYEVIQFELNLSENLVHLQKELYNGTYRLSGYRRFEIYDPKPRTIYAMHYRDRIIQLLEHIIGSYSVAQGVGIPLGNQTSSWFASCYHGNTWNLRKNLNSHLILSKETEEERKKAYQDLFHKNNPKGESEESL